jgi:elongation factor Ts
LCETDFVASNEEFKSLANEIAMQVSAMSPENREELLAQECIKSPDLTIEKKIQLLSGKIGEKIELGRFNRIQVGI